MLLSTKLAFVSLVAATVAGSMMSIGGNVCFIEGGFGFRPSFIGLKNSDTPIIKMRTRAIVVEQLCWANPPSSSAFPANCELCDLTDFSSNNLISMP